MYLQKRNIGVDEELGKKDDDHSKRRSAATMTSSSSSPFTWRGPRRKRILIALVFLSVLYIFVINLPTDALPATQRQASKHRPSSIIKSEPLGPKDMPMRPENFEENLHYYEGPIRFFNLASSLGVSLGASWDNRNVLFVVSNLKSAASLIPLACDMVKQNKNHVHMMLTGRDDLSIQDIEKANGIHEDDCSIIWHDGRPDYSVYSTDYRMEMSARASFKHLMSALEAKVVIVDSPEREDSFFSSAMRFKTAELGVRLIELPLNAAEKLQWISKLDSQSLRAWSEVSIDILIHAPSEASGSLIRLLKSLEKADYFGFPLPRITIELPHIVDPPTLQYLSDFKWPPSSRPADSRLTVRHRLIPNPQDSAQMSLRQVESFYPNKVPDSDILVLSSSIELSPLYFQYLIYTILQYKYATTALHTSSYLSGISLARPSTTLNGKDPLSPPKLTPQSSLFLYQAPSSDAALYFGDKWIELHSFLSNRLKASTQTSEQNASSDFSYPISPAHPAWLAYMLELSRLKAYTMLYPAASNAEDVLAAIHTDLSPTDRDTQTPLPTASNLPPSPSSPSSSPGNPKPILDTPLPPKLPHPPSLLLSPPHSLLHILTPNLAPSTPALESGPALPDLHTLPILSHTGTYLEQGRTSLTRAAMLYQEEFSRVVGRCKDGSGEAEREGGWFCFGDG